jgi:hypothetical protein
MIGYIQRHPTRDQQSRSGNSEGRSIRGEGSQTQSREFQCGTIKEDNMYKTRAKHIG